MENGIHGYHPFVMLMYYIYIGSLAMYVTHPIFLVIGTLLIVAVNFTHDRGRTLRKWFPIYGAMIILIVVLNPFLVSRGTNILFYFRGKQVTLEALMYGIVMALSIVIILMLFLSFNHVLNGNKFLFIFSRILPRTAFLMMLAIRFVPLLKDRLDEINAVQRVRGLTMTDGPIRQRAKTGLVKIQILLTWSMEEAVQTADSMKVRGYGSGRKTSYMPYRMEGRDWGWLASMTGLFAIVIAGGSLGYGKILIYPELGTLHLFALDWVVLAAMTVLYSFPLLVEGREYIRWMRLT
ncbi:Energy-coupling factor transporter transmembrane protein EcfT [Lentibacillus sp. JNUCC-1]|uniref:energy-coupling factor transporter transmembrane component T n=1 Tax=Lentibacillus sp. JNUCC-1 TaxID=2654513 RepID=UPI0012E7BD59|nr:energy-coupling factor transporter transmembrane component T [Lentibacillus sp. JNUCC-1]MUV37570.1 Energy-coupling factor transporter transmembrane protein EcfT [Lentibacillus sp. JNUCC-1]